jgi:hypothetical protein
MSTTAETDEWDQFVYKIGLLTLAMGTLEAAIMAMHCKATNQREADLESRLNKAQRDGLKRAVESLDWPDYKKADLARRLSDIAALDKRRNNFIHIAAARVADNSIAGVPAGSVIDGRTYGLGVTSSDGTSWTIGVVAKRIDLTDIDKLFAEINEARLGLVPYMELVDAIKHPPTPLGEFVDRLKKGTLLS